MLTPCYRYGVHRPPWALVEGMQSMSMNRGHTVARESLDFFEAVARESLDFFEGW